jgi:beta-lactamase regulating signal transducer with metallopeptidase domain
VIQPHFWIDSINRLFYPMLDATIKGSVLLLIAGAVCLALRRDSAATRHMVWATAVLLLLIMPLLSILLPQWRVLPAWSQASQDLKPPGRQAPGVVGNPGQAIRSPRITNSGSGIPIRVVDPEPSTAGVPESLPTLSGELDFNQEKSLLGTMSGEPVALLTVVWLAGCVLVMLRLSIALLLLRWSASRCRALQQFPEGAGPSPTDRCIGDVALLAATHTAAARLGINRSVPLLLDPLPSIPVVWGIFRPRLRLPSNAVDWSVDQQHAVLLHELAHIRRNDLAILAMTQLTCVVNWCNPLLWLAAWRMHVERERACDDLVLGAGIRPSTYAGHLVELVTRLRPAGWTRACGLAMARKSALEDRLTAVLSAQTNRRGLTRFAVGAALLVGAIVAVPVAMLHAGDTAPYSPPVADENRVAEAAPVLPQNSAKLKSGVEEKLQWGKPRNGLRAALVRPQALGEPATGEHLDLKVVVQNVSDGPIRFRTGSASLETAALEVLKDGETLFRIHDSKRVQADFTLGPREVAVVRLFVDRAEGRSITSEDPAMTFYAELPVENTTGGAWTGKLVTADTVALFSSYGLVPKNKDAKELFTSWNSAARRNGKIPGALVRQLAESVLALTKLNPAWERTPQLWKMLARFDSTRDWSGPEATALMDELAAVQAAPIRMALDQEVEREIHRGVALAPELANAPWGAPLPNGLRLAWLLEPRAAAYPLGTALMSRILIHNAGQTPVVFRTRTWHQANHRVTNASGAEIKVDSVEWTTRGRLVPFRLGPGEFVEVDAAGVGIGANRDDDDWQSVRVGSWVEATAGDDVTVTAGPVLLGDRSDDAQPGGEPRWWLDLITNRVARHLPLPADAEERTRLLYRLSIELFGTPLGEEEYTAFVADGSPSAAQSLARRLARRPEASTFSGALQSAPTSFRVLPADPSAARKPLIAREPGRYTLGDDAVLVVSRRPLGESIVNEASIEFASRERTNVVPVAQYEINLPVGFHTWAAAWMRDGSILWVQDNREVRAYDFSNPTSVRIEATKPEQLPVAIRDALLATLAATGAQPAAESGVAPASAAP